MITLQMVWSKPAVLLDMSAAQAEGSRGKLPDGYNYLVPQAMFFEVVTKPERERVGRAHALTSLLATSPDVYLLRHSQECREAERSTRRPLGRIESVMWHWPALCAEAAGRGGEPVDLILGGANDPAIVWTEQHNRAGRDLAEAQRVQFQADARTNGVPLGVHTTHRQVLVDAMREPALPLPYARYLGFAGPFWKRALVAWPDRFYVGYTCRALAVGLATQYFEAKVDRNWWYDLEYANLAFFADWVVTMDKALARFVQTIRPSVRVVHAIADLPAASTRR